MNQNKSLIEEARLKKKAEQDDKEINKQVEQIRYNMMHRRTNKSSHRMSAFTKNGPATEYGGSQLRNLSPLGHQGSSDTMFKQRPETGMMSKAVTFYEDDIRSSSNRGGYTSTKSAYSKPLPSLPVEPMSKIVYGKY